MTKSHDQDTCIGPYLRDTLHGWGARMWSFTVHFFFQLEPVGTKTKELILGAPIKCPTDVRVVCVCFLPMFTSVTVLCVKETESTSNSPPPPPPPPPPPHTHTGIPVYLYQTKQWTKWQLPLRAIRWGEHWGEYRWGCWGQWGEQLPGHNPWLCNLCLRGGGDSGSGDRWAGVEEEEEEEEGVGNSRVHRWREGYTCHKMRTECLFIALYRYNASC